MEDFTKKQVHIVEENKELEKSIKENIDTIENASTFETTESNESYQEILLKNEETRQEQLAQVREDLGINTLNNSSEIAQEIPHGLDKEDIYKIIKDAPPISSTKEGSAPFAHFAENTHESWNVVSPEEVEEYLNSKLFFDTSKISSESREEKAEIIVKSSEEAIKIPLDLVVKATGFEDWRGRPKRMSKEWQIKTGTKKISGEMASLDVIKMYAGTPSDIPSVTSMRMYIQPDKKVFFDNSFGDSHRIAAAILRGDKNIETRNLIVYQLDRNYL